MGRFNLSKKVDKALDIVDQVVPDVDKRNELRANLQEVRAGLMLSGKGGRVTKYTICFLVSLVVSCLAYGFMINPTLLDNAEAFSRAASPLIIILIGVVGTGGVFKNSRWSKRSD